MKVDRKGNENMTDVQLAQWVCENALNELFRWDGVTPSSVHSKRIAQNVYKLFIGKLEEQEESDLLSVCWLHDVVEDSETTLEDLRNIGFNDKIVEAVSALTKGKDEDYVDYINRVANNQIALVVKIADLEDNLADIPEGRATNHKTKYRLAKMFLCERVTNNFLYLSFKNVQQTVSHALAHG